MKLVKQTLFEMLYGIHSKHQGIVLKHRVHVKSKGRHQIDIGQIIGSVAYVFGEDLIPAYIYVC